MSGSDMYNCFNEHFWSWQIGSMLQIVDIEITEFKRLTAPRLFGRLQCMYYIYGSVWAIPAYIVYQLYDADQVSACMAQKCACSSNQLFLPNCFFRCANVNVFPTFNVSILQVICSCIASYLQSIANFSSSESVPFLFDRQVERVYDGTVG